MSTITFAGKPVRTIREWKRSLPTTQPHCVSTVTSVRADRHRIFQALTVPEYIEAWFSAPDAIEGSTKVFAQENSFSISYAHRDCGCIKIFCSYKVRRRGKLLFSWERNGISEGASSMVNIRLLGDFGRTTVHVIHGGLAQSEQQWHEDLWESSIRKFSKLF
jgi:uncharacterized protein YndB with AHSA1/START domain